MSASELPALNLDFDLDPVAKPTAHVTDIASQVRVALAINESVTLPKYAEFSSMVNAIARSDPAEIGLPTTDDSSDRYLTFNTAHVPAAKTTKAAKTAARDPLAWGKYVDHDGTSFPMRVEMDIVCVSGDPIKPKEVLDIVNAACVAFAGRPIKLFNRRAMGRPNWYPNGQTNQEDTDLFFGFRMLKAIACHTTPCTSHPRAMGRRLFTCFYCKLRKPVAAFTLLTGTPSSTQIPISSPYSVDRAFYERVVDLENGLDECCLACKSDPNAVHGSKAAATPRGAATIMGDGRYSCAYCDKSFRRLPALRSHVQTCPCNHNRPKGAKQHTARTLF
jgi:hypothetical protein